MLFPNGRWLMCWPKYFDVSYEINPWMKVTYKPSAKQAWTQWQRLHHTIIKLGGWVDYIEPIPNQPDMVFTANGGLIRGKRCILSHFRYKERMGEEPAFKNWFLEQGYDVREIECSFEGEGDALFMGQKLFTGYGFRSDKEAENLIRDFLEVTEVIPLQLVDPYFYHLDTCFCPINERQALCATMAFSPESLAVLKSKAQLIEVPLDEAKQFACNAVVLGSSIVIPAGCPETCANLKKAGLEPYEVELTEFIKSGGAAKCLTLKLQN
ncbi:MAG: amidinotransferase [Deltaproteobacteria bacterium]|nr:amidinotransferase [Deltaproteobacteria bacterium]